MANTLTKYGREFEFDEGVPEDVQHKRVDAWMKQNAPTELEQPAPTQQPAGKPGNFSGDKLTEVARALGLPGLGLFAAATTPGGRERVGDVNTYRTLAQGALPFADEATAGVRSLIPGQPSYGEALGQERQGVKDYGEKYGEADKVATELLGAGLGMVGTMGAGPLLQGARGVPWLGKAGQWLMKNPLKGSVATGATAGGIAGFGSGEGGLGPRMESARDNAALGAILGPVATAGVKAGEKGLGYLNTENRVADFLRRRIASERPAVANSTTLPRTKAGGVDPNAPGFVNEAMSDLRSDIGNQRNRLYTDPMLADVLPGATESVLQKRGPKTEELARTLRNRQYNETVPEATARAMGQRGRVESAFDLAFGPDNFKHTDEQLVERMKGNAKQLFDPAYQHNLRSRDIDDALNKLHTLDPNMYTKIWNQSKRAMEAENKSIGGIDALGNNLSSYNTEFLHNIKRHLDTELGVANKAADYKFNDVPYLKAKTELNDAMKNQNGAYKIAMEQYGDDASLIDALKKGRTEVFKGGSEELGGGMKGESIKAHLNDPNVTPAQRDLFKLGAARALRENTLASGSKKFSHNWADFVNNPETEDRMGALLTDKMGSWDLLRAQLKKESQNYKQYSGAVGNSKTSAREDMKREMAGMDIGRIGAGIANPAAFGTSKAIIDAIKNKIDPGTILANKTAELLGRTGAKGNRSALNDIERLLRQQDARSASYGRSAVGVAPAAAYGWPYREEQF